MVIENNGSTDKQQQPSVLESRRQLPKTPDFSSQWEARRRTSPFILDDFKGSNAYKGIHP